MMKHEHHGLSWLGAFIEGTLDNGGRGFCYAGQLGGLLKIGMTRRCPLCRMQQQRLAFLGIVYSDEPEIHEHRIIKALGDPVQGREWFSDPKSRFAFLVEHRFMHDVYEKNFEINLEYAMRHG
jgi:hypothetical protein